MTNNSTQFLYPTKALPRTAGLGGSDSPWDELICAVWRSLADQDANVVLPSIDWIEKNLKNSRTPPEYLGQEDAYLALWTSVLDILKYSFSWQSPAHGVACWIESGCPIDDRRFAIIAHLLGDDFRARAVNLAAFLFLLNGWELSRFGHGGLVTRLGNETPHQCENVPEWVQSEFNQRGCGDNWDGPIVDSPYYLPCRSGGWDNLHISGHCWTPITRTAMKQGAPMRGFSLSESKTATSFYSDQESGTAVLITDTYRDWYDDLNDFGNQLEPLKTGRSWRVEVLCKPIGWLGTFRKSRDTGLWFSGPHSLHVWGKPT